MIKLQFADTSPDQYKVLDSFASNSTKSLMQASLAKQQGCQNHNYSTQLKTFNRNFALLVLSMCQLIHHIAEGFIAPNTLDPLCVNSHTLNALLQRSRNRRCHSAGKELFCFLGFLISAELK